MSKTRYIHIGWPKAASTTLQQHFFSRCPQLFHLGLPAWKSPALRAALLIECMEAPDYMYNASATKSMFETCFSQANADGSIKAVGISHEGICINLAAAARLKDIFGDAKIIMIIRSQESIIKSLYFNMVSNGAFLTFEDFLQSHYANPFNPYVRGAHYYEVYRYLADLYGKQAIGIFLFEKLKMDQKSFLLDICNFIGIDDFTPELPKTNTTNSLLATNLIRFGNFIYRHNFGDAKIRPAQTVSYAANYADYLGVSYPTWMKRHRAWRVFLNRSANRLDKWLKLKPASFTISPEWKDRLIKLYGSGNCKLADETGIDLSKFNYPLA